MSDIERFAAGYILISFLGLTTMLVFFSRKRWVEYFKRFSTLQKMAMSFLAGLAAMLLMWGIMFLFIGKDALPIGFVLCGGGALSFINIQSRYRKGKLKKSSFARHTEFDERDYRIGQDAIHAAYLAFWIVIFTTCIALYLAIAAFKVTPPAWGLLLALPLTAFTVSVVHAVSILINYRRDSGEVVENG